MIILAFGFLLLRDYGYGVHIQFMKSNVTELLTSDAPTPPAASTPKRRRCRRYNGKSNGKARLLTLADLDKRTAAAQCALQLVEAISNDLGGADQLTQCTKQLVRRAAVLAAYLESCEVKWLKGENIELLDYLSA